MLVFLILLPIVAMGTPRVSVLALFPGRALVVVDGVRHRLRVGESSPEGVRLVAADSRGAVLEIAGQRLHVGLSHTVGGPYQRPAQSEVRIGRDNRGLYTTTGSINGLAVGFLVDTGSTLVALNEAQAVRLGIDFRRNGTRMLVATASGRALAYRVTLDRIRVGDIRMTDVPALVIEGSEPATPLLGMSFLGRLQMRHEGSLLILDQVH